MPEKLEGLGSLKYKIAYEEKQAKKKRDEEEEARRLEEEELALIKKLESKLLEGNDREIKAIEEQCERLSHLRKSLSQGDEEQLKEEDETNPNTNSISYEDLPPTIRSKFVTPDARLLKDSRNQALISMQGDSPTPSDLPDWEAEDEDEIRKELKRIMQSRGKGLKRTPAQVLLDRAEIAQLLRRGWSKAQIADRMGVSVTQVTHDWKIIIKEVQTSRDSNTLEKINELLEQYAEVKKEAWQAWERSKLECERESVEEEQVRQIEEIESEDDECDEEDEPRTRSNKSLRSAKSNTRKMQKQVSQSSDMTTRRRVIKRGKEGRNPGNEYLKTILMCLEAERELQALNPSKEIDVQGTVNWDILACGIPDEMEDQIEKKIVEAMGYNSEQSPVYQTPREHLVLKRKEDSEREQGITRYETDDGD